MTWLDSFLSRRSNFPNASKQQANESSWKHLHDYLSILWFLLGFVEREYNPSHAILQQNLPSTNIRTHISSLCTVSTFIFVQGKFSLIMYKSKISFYQPFDSRSTLCTHNFHFWTPENRALELEFVCAWFPRVDDEFEHGHLRKSARDTEHKQQDRKWMHSCTSSNRELMSVALRWSALMFIENLWNPFSGLRTHFSSKSHYACILVTLSCPCDDTYAFP